MQVVPVAETQAQTYENPVYNQRLQFDVYDDNDRVLIEVVDQKVLGTQISTYIRMAELRQYMDDLSIEVKDLWFNFDQEAQNMPGGGQGDPYRAQIRINFNYMYSKYFMYEQQCAEWKTQLQEDVNDYNNIERYLD